MSIPKEPNRRRLLICVKSLSDLTKNAVLLPNPFTSGVTIVEPEALKRTEIGITLDEASVREDAVFVQSPFDYSSYYTLETAQCAFAIRKALLTSQFCRYLGANRYEVEAFEDDFGQKTVEVSATLKNPAVDAEADWKREQIRKIKSAISFVEESKGANPDFEQASLFLKENHLERDTHLEHLLKSVSNQENRLKEHKFETSLIEETSSTIDIGSRLDLKKCLTEIDGKFKLAKIRNFHLSYKVRIQFP